MHSEECHAIKYLALLLALYLAAATAAYLMDEQVFASLMHAPMLIGITLVHGTTIGIPLLVSIYGAAAIVAVVATLFSIGWGMLRVKKTAGKGALALGIVAYLALCVLGLGHGG